MDTSFHYNIQWHWNWSYFNQISRYSNWQNFSLLWWRIPAPALALTLTLLLCWLKMLDNPPCPEMSISKSFFHFLPFQTPSHPLASIKLCQNFKSTRIIVYCYYYFFSKTGWIQSGQSYKNTWCRSPSSVTILFMSQNVSANCVTNCI